MSPTIIVRASGERSATITATLIRRVRPFVVEEKIFFLFVYSMATFWNYDRRMAWQFGGSGGSDCVLFVSVVFFGLIFFVFDWSNWV